MGGYACCALHCILSCSNWFTRVRHDRNTWPISWQTDRPTEWRRAKHYPSAGITRGRVISEAKIVKMFLGVSISVVIVDKGLKWKGNHHHTCLTSQRRVIMSYFLPKLVDTDREENNKTARGSPCNWIWPLLTTQLVIRPRHLSIYDKSGVKCSQAIYWL